MEQYLSMLRELKATCPRTIAHAITIHKAQGATLGEVFVDLNYREHAAGCLMLQSLLSAPSRA